MPKARFSLPGALPELPKLLLGTPAELYSSIGPAPKEESRSIQTLPSESTVIALALGIANWVMYLPSGENSCTRWLPESMA